MLGTMMTFEHGATKVNIKMHKMGVRVTRPSVFCFPDFNEKDKTN